MLLPQSPCSFSPLTCLYYFLHPTKTILLCRLVLSVSLEFFLPCHLVTALIHNTKKTTRLKGTKIPTLSQINIASTQTSFGVRLSRIPEMNA